MLKKLKAAILILLVTFSLLPAIPAFAAEKSIIPNSILETIPDNQTGSITVTLTESEDDRSRENVILGLIKVADIKSGKYVLTDAFSKASIDLNAIESANQMEEAALDLMNSIDQNSTDYQKVKTTFDGKATFNNLEVGVYLIWMLDPALFEFVVPFLASIPTFNERSGEMEYNLEIYPKHSQLPKFEVNKVDKDSGRNITNKSFEFTSYKDPECSQAIITVPGDKDRGTALFEVDYGVTYIKETAAPTGYLLSDEVVKVDVSDEGIFINDKLATSEDDLLYSIVYVNSLKGSIHKVDGAHTSSNSGIFLYIGTTGLALMILVVTSIRRKIHTNQ